MVGAADLETCTLDGEEVAFSEGKEREGEGLDAQYRAPESMTPPLVLALLFVAVVTGVGVAIGVTSVLIYGILVRTDGPEVRAVDEDMSGGTETLPAGLDWRERKTDTALDQGRDKGENGV